MGPRHSAGFQNWRQRASHPVAVNGRTARSFANRAACQGRATEEMFEKMARKGIKLPEAIRAMIIGIPERG